MEQGRNLHGRSLQEAVSFMCNDAYHVQYARRVGIATQGQERVVQAVLGDGGRARRSPAKGDSSVQGYGQLRAPGRFVCQVRGSAGSNMHCLRVKLI